MDKINLLLVLSEDDHRVKFSFGVTFDSYEKENQTELQII